MSWLPSDRKEVLSGANASESEDDGGSMEQIDTANSFKTSELMDFWNDESDPVDFLHSQRLFETPRVCADKIVKIVKQFMKSTHQEFKSVVDVGAGNGALSRAFLHEEDLNVNVFAIEMNPQRKDSLEKLKLEFSDEGRFSYTIRDVRNVKLEATADLVITNPPFSNIFGFLHYCTTNFLPETGTCAVVAPAKFFSTKGRLLSSLNSLTSWEMHSKNWSLGKVDFFAQCDSTGKSSKTSQEVCLYIFRKNVPQVVKITDNDVVRRLQEEFRTFRDACSAFEYVHQQLGLRIVKLSLFLRDELLINCIDIPHYVYQLYSLAVGSSSLFLHVAQMNTLEQIMAKLELDDNMTHMFKVLNKNKNFTPTHSPSIRQIFNLSACVVNSADLKTISCEENLDSTLIEKVPSLTNDILDFFIKGNHSAVTLKKKRNKTTSSEEQIDANDIIIETTKKVQKVLDKACDIYQTRVEIMKLDSTKFKAMTLYSLGFLRHLWRPKPVETAPIEPVPSEVVTAQVFQKSKDRQGENRQDPILIDYQEDDLMKELTSGNLRPKSMKRNIAIARTPRTPKCVFCNHSLKSNDKLIACPCGAKGHWPKTAAGVPIVGCDFSANQVQRRKYSVCIVCKDRVCFEMKDEELKMAMLNMGDCNHLVGWSCIPQTKMTL